MHAPSRLLALALPRFNEYERPTVTGTETAPAGTTPATGRWLLVTESSSYELDLDAHACRRTPADAAQRSALAGQTVYLTPPAQ